MNSVIRSSALATRIPVLIVGGGLGGFTAALSLHRAGIQSNIIMPESKFTQHARSSVFLGGPAVRILDRLGLGPQYRGLGIPIFALEVEDTKGRNLLKINLDNHGTEVWTVPRENLQQILLEAIPPESVYANTKFRSLSIDEDRVHVKVQQGTARLVSFQHSPVPGFDTQFVIGADGLNSTVRAFMSRPVMTVPSGNVLWQAVVRNRNLEQFPRHIGKEIWDTGLRFGFARMNKDEVVWWAIASNLHEVILRPFSPHLLRMFQNFPRFVIELISSVETDRNILRTEMKRIWQERFPWVDHAISRIALVGDAGRPDNVGNFHMSHTLAVEDSYLLANLLAEQNEKGMLAEGPRLRRYEANREERTAMTNQLADRFLRLSKSSSSIPRYLAKLLLHASLGNLAMRGAPTVSLTTSGDRMATQV